MRKPKAIPLPPSHHARAQALGLRVVCHRNEVQAIADGSSEYLPRDLIGLDGKSLIVWRNADRDYAIDGYEPWHDGMFGGRCANIHGALGWIERAKDIRAGRATHF